jgi:hypothetical protein
MDLATDDGQQTTDTQLSVYAQLKLNSYNPGMAFFPNEPKVVYAKRYFRMYG